MTARDDLYSIASSDMPVTSDEVNEAIDAFAHQLAEQIRAADLDWGRVPDMDARDAADLIDPKAQRAATTGDNA